MKYFLVNRKNYKDNLFIGQSNFNLFLWQQGLYQVIDTLLSNNQLINKYKIQDQSNTQYSIQQFIDIIEKLQNKN